MRGNSSACSRITGLTAVVTSTRSISWRMFFRAFSIMSRVTWSISCSRTKSGWSCSCNTILLCLLDQDVPETVDGARVARLDDRCGVVLYDDCGTRNGVSGSKLATDMDRGLGPPAVEVHLHGARDRARGILSCPVLAL